MVRIFTKEENRTPDGFTVTGNDYNHVKNVLRMREGDVLQALTEDERVFNCEIVSLSDGALKLRICSEEEAGTELKAELWLFQGLPKGDKFETVLQKAVELGAHAVVPVLMKRCVAKVDPKKAGAKLKRYAAIAEAAAKQSKRSIIPQAGPFMTMKEAVEFCRDFDRVFVPYENAVNMKETKALFAGVRAGERVAVFIGPEGGFEEEEVRAVEAIGGHAVTLGKRILRTETAGMTVLSVLMFGLEE